VDLRWGQVVGLGQGIAALQGGDVAPHQTAALLTHGLQARFEQRVWAFPRAGLDLGCDLEVGDGLGLHLGLRNGLRVGTDLKARDR